MTSKNIAIPKDIGDLIYEVRGQRVMLDQDLAAVYGVKTERLNQQVDRNKKRFPDDFVFRLTKQEYESLTLQIARSKKSGRGGRRHMPYVFTEHGAVMAANVLNSPRAVQMSVFVVRAFVRMRAAFMDSKELARKLAALEKDLKARLDVHESAIVTVFQRVMDMIDPPPFPVPKHRRIGFGGTRD